MRGIAADNLKNPVASEPHQPWADDPIAKSIEWTGTSSWTGTARGVGRDLHSIGDSRVELQPWSLRNWHSFILLLTVGGAIVMYFGSGSIAQGVGTLLAGMGLNFLFWLLSRVLEPIVFDKRLGIFWEGRKQPEQIMGQGSAKYCGQIADIYALQLIHSYHFVGGGSDGRKNDNFELNLVMKDGARLSIVCLYDIASLRRDARVLAEFLGKPLWDAC